MNSKEVVLSDNGTIFREVTETEFDRIFHDVYCFRQGKLVHISSVRVAKEFVLEEHGGALCPTAVEVKKGYERNNFLWYYIEIMKTITQALTACLSCEHRKVAVCDGCKRFEKWEKLLQAVLKG